MFELTMPKMGESVAEATITQWLKNEGDAIALDESVLTIATDKVDSDIPSPVAGVLVKKLFNENDVIQVGQVIAHIETGTAQPAASNPQPAASSPQPAASSPQPAASNPQPEARNQEPAASSQAPVTKGSGSRFYSPLVRSMAAQEGLSQADLDQIDGSGQEGRVTKHDVLAYLAQRMQMSGGLVGTTLCVTRPAGFSTSAKHTTCTPVATAVPVSTGLRTVKSMVATARKTLRLCARSGWKVGRRHSNGLTSSRQATRATLNVATVHGLTAPEKQQATPLSVA